MSWRAALANAFSVKEPPLEAEDEALLGRLAEEVARRRLQAPAVLLLESVRPLNFVGSQAMVFLQPFVPAASWGRLAAILERRSSIDFLVRKIEIRRD